MKKSSSIFIVIILSTITIQAQNHRFQFGIGYQRTWMLDKQASLLKYQSSEKTFLLGFDHNGTESRWDVEFDGALGNFFPTGYHDRYWYNTHNHPDGSYTLDSFLMKGKLYGALLNIGYAQRVRHGISKMGNTDFTHSSFAGASLSNSIFYSDNTTREGWINSTAFNSTYENIHASGKHILSVKLIIPLIARNTRLPFHNTISDPNIGNTKTFFKNNHFAWPVNFHQLKIIAEYSYSLGRHSDIGIRYNGNWMHYNYERPINIIQNNISLIGSFK